MGAIGSVDDSEYDHLCPNGGFPNEPDAAAAVRPCAD